MNICLASVYHASSYYGGNEHYAHYLAKGLKQKKQSVTYLTAKAKRASGGYPVMVIPTPFFMGKAIPVPNWISHEALQHADIYHASGSGLPLIASALWLKHKRPQIPRILTFQAASYPSKWINRFLAKGEEKMISQSFTHFITTSPFYLKQAKRLFPRGSHHMIPLFISDYFMKRSPTIPNILKQLKKSSLKIILFVGKLDSHHYYKGLPYLLRAIKQLPPTFHLIVIGDGELLESYQAMVKELGIKPNVHFLGSIKHANLPGYYTGADCFVLPSHSSSEGFGMVAIEAMSQQLPVIITSAIGSASWFKSAKVATVVPPKQSQAIANAIINVCAHERQDQLKRALAFSHQLSEQNMINDTVKLYESILNK